MRGQTNPTLRLGNACPVSARTCKVPPGLEVHSVLGGLLMLMMTCKKDQAFRPATAKALVSAPQDCLFAHGAHILALLYYAEYNALKDVALSIGAVSDRTYEQLTCKGKQHHSHKCCRSQEAQRLRRHTAHHAHPESL